MNAETAEILKDLLIVIIPSLIAGLPGTIALFKLRSENRKTTSEAGVSDASAAEQLTHTSLSLVDRFKQESERSEAQAVLYKKDMEDLKCGFTECKRELIRLSDEIINLKESNKKLEVENHRLSESNYQLTLRISTLEGIITNLVEQIKELGHIPRFSGKDEPQVKGE